MHDLNVSPYIGPIVLAHVVAIGTLEPGLLTTALITNVSQHVLFPLEDDLAIRTSKLVVVFLFHFLQFLNARIGLKFFDI